MNYMYDLELFKNPHTKNFRWLLPSLTFSTKGVQHKY